VALLFGLQPAALQGLSLLALTLLGVWASDRAEAILGQRDPRPVILDEVIGMVVTLAWLDPSPLAVGVGFILFRVGDIVKVPPGGWLERHAPGGLAVVADDVVAGIYANIGTRLFLMWTG
jgi:phosphatidylglycerophosphatase A